MPPPLTTSFEGPHFIIAFMLQPYAVRNVLSQHFRLFALLYQARMASIDCDAAVKCSGVAAGLQRQGLRSVGISSGSVGAAAPPNLAP